MVKHIRWMTTTTTTDHFDFLGAAYEHSGTMNEKRLVISRKTRRRCALFTFGQFCLRYTFLQIKDLVAGSPIHADRKGGSEIALVQAILNSSQRYEYLHAHTLENGSEHVSDIRSIFSRSFTLTLKYSQRILKYQTLASRWMMCQNAFSALDEKKRIF